MIGRTAKAFDDALATRTPQTAEIAALVDVAEQLCLAASVTPDPQFRADLRARLVAEAPSVGAKRAPAAPRRRLPAVSKVSAAGFAAAGVIGMVTASAQAMPGDPLYPVKRAVEQIQVSLQPSDAGKSTAQLASAQRRLAEASNLADDNSASSSLLVGEALNEFVSVGTEGTAPLLAGPLGGTDAAQLSEFIASASVLLAELKGNLPEGTLDEYSLAVAFVDSLAHVLSTACTECSDTDLSEILGNAPAVDKSPTVGKTSGVVAPKPTVVVPVAPTPKVAVDTPKQATATPGDDVTTEPITGLIPKLLKGLLN